MNFKKQKKLFKDRIREGKSNLTVCLFCFFIFLIAWAAGSFCFAVTSKVVRQASGEQLGKGQADDVIVSSRGTIRLGRSAEVLISRFVQGDTDANKPADVSEPWSVNSIVVNAGTVYIGTSPNGGLYSYSLGALKEIYSARPSQADEESQQAEPVKQADAYEPNDVNTPPVDANEPGEEVKAERYLANEHIFAMAIDVSGRLLAGVSGEQARLCRLEAGQLQTIFEPNDVKYIFAIEVSDAGDIFLGTGPKGRVYRLDPFGKNPELIYQSRDKNILSLAVRDDGFVYAGSDQRGLVYRIDPKNKTATVLYDSEQEEVTALVFGSGEDAGCLYAAATSAKIIEKHRQFPFQTPGPGRVEAPPGATSSKAKTQGGRKLQIANTKEKEQPGLAQKVAVAVKPLPPGTASVIYRISEEGFVTDVFHQTAVFFALAGQQDKLLVGTGNQGRLYSIEPLMEEHAVVYEDRNVSQITAVVALGDDLYLGTANPAKLIKLGKDFASQGSYTSDLIDAGQPARWGKLQIDADIPQGCKVAMSCRSGNVKDVNDPTFSQWTESAEVTGAMELGCPLGRFCQYKLVLESADGHDSPLIREVAVAHVVPNLAPRIEQVAVSRDESKEKAGLFKIIYKPRDDNEDKLIYRIDFRKAGRSGWIEIENKLEADSFEWDGRTVEDGRYEIRVTASDERSNTAETKLTASRISDSVVVDNTGPAIKEYTLEKDAGTVTLKLKVTDELSAIGQLDYTVDSNCDWTGTLPEDSVYDTTEEAFTVVIEKLAAGEHVVSVRIRDDVGNSTYKSFDVEIAD